MPLPLFVYGTLMEGGERAPLLAGLSRRAARVRGRLYLMPGGYPALQPARPHEEVWVHGELVSPPPQAVLSVLDRYEGVEEGLFRRIEIIAYAALAAAPAWTWIMTAPRSEGGRLLPSGRWRGSHRR